MSDTTNKKKKYLVLTEKYPIFSTIQGTVLSHHGFGIFLDINESSFKGFIRVPDISDDVEVASSGGKLWPKIGEAITGVVIDHTEYNFQICVSLRKSDFRH